MQSVRETISSHYCWDCPRIESDKAEEKNRGRIDSTRGWRVQAGAMEMGNRENQSHKEERKKDCTGL